MARVIVGTSGWHYASWRGPFFPDKLLAKHQLRYYASQFDTTELNGVFYRTPTEEAVRGLVIWLIMECARNQTHELTKLISTAAASPQRVLGPQAFTVQWWSLRFCLISNELGHVSQSACRHRSRALPKQ
jgi:hypothetical protein